LEVNLEPRRLTIAGKRETKEEHKTKKTIYSERCSGQILRVLDLPAEVDTEKTKATLKDGILELEIPKAASSKGIRIEPKAG
jgi:HSP20 family protein